MGDGKNVDDGTGSVKVEENMDARANIFVLDENEMFRDGIKR